MIHTAVSTATHQDGTLHVLITPELSGSTEAIEPLRENVAEIDKLGVTTAGTAMGIFAAPGYM